MAGTEAQKRRERLLRKSANICPTMLADIRCSAADPTVRSTATHDGARPDTDDAGRPCRGDHHIIRDVLKLALADAIDYACGSRTYDTRQAVEWMRHDDEGNPPPWSFDWCCRELGADPGAAFKAINEYSINCARNKRERSRTR